MSKLAALLKDTSKEEMLHQYALEHGHDILYVFQGQCDFANKQFLAMIDFVTNYDICQGALIYSVEDIYQNEYSNIFRWFLDKVNRRGKSFYCATPFKIDNTPLPVESINKLDTIFLTQWTKLESKVRDIYKPYPDSISILVREEKCFARCRMCYWTRNPKNLVDARMDMGLFKKIIDDIPPDAESRLSIGSAGETLCFPEVFEMVKYISDTKPRLTTCLYTNGVLLDEKMGRAIIQSGLKEITISINAATCDDYRWLMGIDTYEQVVENTHNFVQLRNKLSSPAPQVLMKLRGRFVDTTSRISVRLRNKFAVPTSRVLTPLRNMLRSAGPMPRVVVQMMGIKRFEKQIENFIEQWEGVVDSVIIRDVLYCTNDPELENIERLKAPEFPIVPNCNFLMGNVRVWPDGRFYLCCNQDWSEERFAGPDLGNARDINLFTLWCSDKYNEIRKANIRGLPVIKACLTCDAMKHDFVTDLLMKSKLRKEFGPDPFSSLALNYANPHWESY